ncbi:putative chitinase [Starmerella bacillaris]|uniref:Chitinase n=1 Tax=Starmerella bacillaris TaxID=1247836 RepID=A0AAV5RPZ0_STABA|nr:putative chitinase [Starmerella bacillaris]
MVLAAYFANWSIYSKNYLPDQLPLDVLTHVIYAFFKPNAKTGSVELSDPWSDVEIKLPSNQLGCINEFHRLQELPENNFKLLLSVGGYTYSPDLTAIFTDSTKRHTFVESIVALVCKYKFDGVDVDWEYPESKKHGDIYVTLLKELRSGLDSINPELQLSVAAPAGKHVLENMNLPAMDRYLSFWNVMTYDFAGGWSPKVAYSSNLYGEYPSGQSVIEYYTRYVRRNKINLGISLYKLTFPNAYKLRGKFSGTPVQTALSLSNNTTGLYDSEYGCAYDIGQDVFECFDNAESIKNKAIYCRKVGLLGAFFWDGSADLRGRDSLIRRFNEELKLK